MNSLAHDIELWLLELRSWVPAADICERFDLSERDLRARGRQPGLLDEFAVSSTRNGHSGFIHHQFLPTEEWIPIKNRITRHAISELRKVSLWKKGRRRCMQSTAAQFSETHTGQLVLF